MSADAPDFDRIVAQYCHYSGEAWTDALEAELTFPRLTARYAFWRDEPPAAAVLTAIGRGMGLIAGPRKTEQAADAALRALFPGGKF